MSTVGLSVHMSRAYEVPLTAYLEGKEDQQVDITYVPRSFDSKLCQAQELLGVILRKLEVPYKPQKCFKMMLVGHKSPSKMLNNRKGYMEQLQSELEKSGRVEICVCYADSPESDDMFEQSIQLDASEYQKQREIGRGRDGVVFVGKDRQDRRVAMKELQKFDPEDMTKLLRLINEIKIMKTSQHPAIMPLIGVIKPGPDCRYPIIVTPLMNCSVQDWIDKKNGVMLTHPRIYIVLYGIASAMMYLHAHDIIHRDLKPANVLLDDKSRPMVTDFGLAKVNSSAHSIQMSASCGTLAYMAPEAFSDRYSGKADVFSYGILMWAILARANPFEGCSSNPTAHQRALENNKRPERPRGGYSPVATEKLLQLMERCWDMDSQKRPTFAEIVQELESDACIRNQDRSLFNAYKEEINAWLKNDRTPVGANARRGEPKEGPSQSQLDNYCADDKVAALIEYGRRYELGTDDGKVQPDLTMAWNYYHKAAKLGSGDGYFCLARCYEYGIGVPKDPIAAAVLYEKADKLKSALLNSSTKKSSS